MSKLEQMRAGIEILIETDKSIGTVTRNAMIDNGRGQLIPEGEPAEHKIVCRVSYQSGGVWSTKPNEGGLTIDTTPFVLARHDANIQQGDVLTVRKKRYSVGVVTHPEIDGGFTCAQAPLVEVK